MNKQAAKKILNEALGYGFEHGTETLYKCPKCNHHKSKLSVNLNKNVFKSWICDYRGRSIRRVIRSFGSYTQLQRWDEIFGRQDLERFDDLFAERSVERNDQTVDLPEEFVSLCHDNIPKTGIYARNYLKSRGITDAEILRWKIGYCFGGEYRNRIVIPSFNDDGNVSYFVARSYNGDTYKYKNPRASKNIVFNELYVNWNEDLILVEGVFDAINAGNSVPILGSTLRTDSSLIKKIVYNDTPVYVALDPDAAEKERKVIKTLLKYDVELYKVDVSGYEDVGSMPKDVFEERKQKATFIDRDNYLLLDLLSAI